ncbi:MAG TPA: TrbG/VirB9 family P-type conjugative transfer protein, partial [Bryobacteraceae bacterium]|nr:TrbG/VirB9 family P-type conjugative transfer protein [Bryobacteraceae bacterium]
TSSRTVSYHETDIVPIATEVRFTTLIELPKEESILEVTCGDKEFWPVNWTGNLAYIKPAKPGSRTNLNLITASGNVYSFLATEISNVAGSHADLKVFVNPVDSTAMVAMKDKPRFIPAGSVEIYKKQAENAQAELAAQQAALKKELEQERIEVRAHATTTIRHDYKYSSSAEKNPFNVTGIYHDDRFTYIEATPKEAPAVYEVKDGKPSLIQFEFDQKTGRYTIDKILDDGYLRVGKSQLRFHRENG